MIDSVTSGLICVKLWERVIAEYIAIYILHDVKIWPVSLAYETRES